MEERKQNDIRSAGDGVRYLFDRVILKLCNGVETVLAKIRYWHKTRRGHHK